MDQIQSMRTENDAQHAAVGKEIADVKEDVMATRVDVAEIKGILAPLVQKLDEHERRLGDVETWQQLHGWLRQRFAKLLNRPIITTIIGGSIVAVVSIAITLGVQRVEETNRKAQALCERSFTQLNKSYNQGRTSKLEYDAEVESLREGDC